MASRSRFIVISLLFFLIGSPTALISSETLITSAPKAISDSMDAIVKGLGFQDLKVSGFDVRDALVGQSVAYEFDVEVDNKVFPIKLLEDVSRWDFVDLLIFRVEGEEDKALAERGMSKKDSMVLPVLPPFELAGPMELGIQDGDDMRLSLPLKTLQHELGCTMAVLKLKNLALDEKEKLNKELSEKVLQDCVAVEDLYLSHNVWRTYGSMTTR